MAFAVHPVPAAYRQPLLGPPDTRFRRALSIAVAGGVLFLALVRLAPSPTPHEAEVEELPERLARLILEEPATATPPTPSATEPKAEVIAPEPTTPPPEAVSEPTPTTPSEPEHRTRRSREEPTPEVAPDRGTAGRERARAEVERELASVTDEVDDALASLASVLPAAETSETASAPASRRRGGRVGAGRSARSASDATVRSTSGATDLRGGALDAEPVDLSEFGALDLAGVPGRDGSTAAPPPDRTGERSARSLMDTVRRYAPGIRFCYDTALESEPDLRGKTVFRITVAADGSVADVEVVEDSLRDADVRTCALSQIRSWRFAAAAGASVFDAPFVFRPEQ
jgi:outer membrane biosynthesis protein TonB